VPFLEFAVDVPFNKF